MTTSTQSAAFLEDLQRRLASYGLSAAGVAWVVKALHPTCPLTIDGLPDSTYMKSARAESRAQETLTAPPGTTTTWDLLIMKAGGDVCSVLWCAVPSGEPFAPGSANAVIGALITGTTVLDTVASVVENTSASNLGSIYGVQNTQLFTHWRTSYSSLTVYMTASALNDGGTIYAGQWPPPSPGTRYASDVFVYDNVADVAVRTLTPTDPSDEDELTLTNPRTYMAPARDGVYVPYRFPGPTIPFREVSLAAFVGVGGQPFPCAVVNTSNTASAIRGALAQQFNAFGNNGVGTLARYNTVLDDCNNGWVIVRGLSPQATMTLKFVQGFEAVPSDVTSSSVTTSPIAQFAKASPPFDPRCFEAYYRITSEMADCYPASWNALGTLASALGSAASYLWPTIRAGGISAIRTFARGLDTPQSNAMARRQVVMTPDAIPPIESVRSVRGGGRSALSPAQIRAEFGGYARRPRGQRPRRRKRGRELKAAAQAMAAAQRRRPRRRKGGRRYR